MCLGLSAAHAQSADLVWDPDGAGNGTIDPADGTWETGASNTSWTEDGGTTNTDFDNRDNVEFANPTTPNAVPVTYTVTISGTVRPSEVLFSADNNSEYVITGGILGSTANGANETSIEVVSGADARIESQMDGRFLVTGDGVLNLQNQIDGELSTDGIGTVTLSGNLTVTDTVTNAGTLNITGGNLTADTVASSGTMDVGAGRTVTAANGVTNQSGGTMTVLGTIDGDLTNNGGGDLTMTGQVAGDLRNFGTLDVAGQVGGDLTSNNGTATIVGPLTVAGTTTNRATMNVDNDLTTNRFLNGDIATIATTATVTVVPATPSANDILNGSGGDLTNNGRIVGNVTNANGGDFTNANIAQIDGDFVNRGVATLGGTITGTLTNGANGDAEALVLSVDGLTNSGEFDVDSGQSLTSATTIQNLSGGQLNVGGSVSGDVDNLTGATIDLSGTLTGDLDNRGTADISGTISGGLDNRGDAEVEGSIGLDLNQIDGTLDFTGDTVIGGGLSLDAAGPYTIDAGIEVSAVSTSNGASSELTVSGLLTSDVVNNGVLAGGGRISGTVLNSNDFFVGDGMSVGGLVTNNGTVRVDGAGSFDAGLSFGARSAVDIRDGAADDTLTVDGGVSGGGDIFLDIDLRAGSGASDVFVANGAVTGNYTINFEVLNPTEAARQTSDILVFDVDGADPTAFNVTQTGLPAATEQLVFLFFQNDTTGDYFVSTGLNPQAGALSGTVALTQSLIGSIVNRPSSPYVVGLAYEDEEKPCGTGIWSRALGGSATVEGETRSPTADITSEITADFYGFQLGGDFACFNGAISGWDLAFGGIGGINFGSTTQPVFELADDGTLTSRQTSTTNADFTQYYGGIYVTAARGPFTADLQYRLEQTDFTVDSVPISGGTGLGLTDTEFGSFAQTLSGSASYSIGLGESPWTIVPTAGFALTQTSTDRITFNDTVSTLELDDHLTAVAFAGGTLSRTTIGQDGTWALNTFGTMTYYADLSDDWGSTFTSASGDMEELSSDPLGDFGEASVGLNYIKILEPGRIGPARQLSASVRADGRLSEDLTSWGLTAQVRLQF